MRHENVVHTATTYNMRTKVKKWIMEMEEKENMNFADALRVETTHTYTENGACALNTTGESLVDFFSTVGALRTADDSRLFWLFIKAAEDDLLMATKILFYARDIREGLGERETFRKILKFAAKKYPEAIRPNIDLIGLYGRYDDLYSLIGTPLENDMWIHMKHQLSEDVKAMRKGEAVSLLAKWLKTADASSANTRKLGILTANKLGMRVDIYKRTYRALRKHIGVIEQLMSQGKWDEIKYPEVPSRAMMLYRNAFIRHDSNRFSEFISKVNSGEEKINAGTLYPYDLVGKYTASGMFFMPNNKADETIETLWNNLPNYINGEFNAMVIADTSGSMRGRPLESALGLAIYFAERNTGAYHNLFMEFSERSRVCELRGETLCDKISNMMRDCKWGGSTNLHGAFDKILEIAKINNVSSEEMPKALIVVSDMEIDCCGDRNWNFYEAMKTEFAEQGYEIPEVIFWNVNSRHDTFLADATRQGVQLVSGQSASTFTHLMSSIGLTAYELMERVINSERYAAITVK